MQEVMLYILVCVTYYFSIKINVRYQVCIYVILYGIYLLLFGGRQFYQALYNLILYGHTSSKSMDQPGKVANPARGQLNRENENFPVRVRACEFGLARRVWHSRPASACSSPYSG